MSYSKEVFLKPIQAEIRQARYALCNLMRIYQLLFQHERCKKSVLFPLGTMGLPQERDPSRECVLHLMSRDFRAMTGNVTGWPIVIYQRLPKEWQNAHECLNKLVPYREVFLKWLNQ